MRAKLPGAGSVPATLADLVARPIRRFLAIETASSIVLLAASVVALAVANSPWHESWEHFWHQRVALEFGSRTLALSLAHWVNDGLMAIFFFVVGLEVKREIAIGELASRERALLPVFGAFGGMVVPALIYALLQPGGEAAAGWGIPMATDIAFAVAALAVFGPRVPPGLKVFLLALAIVDDLGAVAVIALFYTESIDPVALLGAAGGLGLVYLTRLAGVRLYGPYFLLGAGVWLATLASGVHATVAGVLLGLLAPVHAVGGRETLMNRLRERAEAALTRMNGGDRAGASERVLQEVRALSLEAQSPVDFLTHRLHPWVAFVVMPVFALANAGVTLDATLVDEPTSLRVALAVALGLVLGKPIGVAVFALAAERMGLVSLPSGVGPGALLGAGLLAGIGFTMALFITALAFGEGPLAAGAKLGTLGGSLVAFALGTSLLARVLPHRDSSDALTRAP